MNQITHYLDGSAIYGSMRQEEEELRSHRDGLLKVSERKLLPANTQNNEECEANSQGVDCFIAGEWQLMKISINCNIKQQTMI